MADCPVLGMSIMSCFFYIDRNSTMKCKADGIVECGACDHVKLGKAHHTVVVKCWFQFSVIHIVCCNSVVCSWADTRGYVDWVYFVFGHV